jgi:hypothetical protein
MSRQLLINGEQVDVVQDTITAAQLKRQLLTDTNSWVVISDTRGLRQLKDNEVIPSTAERVSIVPAYEYGS